MAGYRTQLSPGGGLTVPRRGSGPDARFRRARGVRTVEPDGVPAAARDRV